MHEAHDAVIVFVCSPDQEAIHIGNTHPEAFLYREPVDANTVSLQHTGMVSTILKNMVHVRVISMNACIEKVAGGLELQDKTNLVFVRDSFVCVNQGVVLCQMKEPVRKKELALVKEVMQAHQIPVWGEIQTGLLEGGDVFICGNTCVLGIGPRSTLEGALAFVAIPEVCCTRLYVIQPPGIDTDMHRIHLDCIFGIVQEDTCVVWEELLVQEKKVRVVDEYQRTETGSWSRVRTEVAFGTWVYEMFPNVIPISTASQRRYGCNILHLSKDIVLVQDAESYEKINGGKLLPFQEVHKMYGGIRCATNVLR